MSFKHYLTNSDYNGIFTSFAPITILLLMQPKPQQHPDTEPPGPLCPADGSSATAPFPTYTGNLINADACFYIYLWQRAT